MAQIVDEELMAELVGLAWGMLDVARAGVAVHVDNEAEPHEVEAARMVNAFTVCVQALVRSVPFNEIGIFAALGTVTGSILAQTPNSAKSYEIFKVQCAATIKEVVSSQPIFAEPEGQA